MKDSEILLLPAPPGASRAPLTGAAAAAPRRARLSSFGTVLAALSCLLATSVLFGALLPLAAGCDPAALTAALAARAQFGQASYLPQPRSERNAASASFPATRPRAAATDGTDAPPTEAPEETTAPEKPDAGEDAAAIRHPITAADLSCGIHSLALFNETAYAPDCAALAEAELPFLSFPVWATEHTDGEPYILILHTHGTEAYAAEGQTSYEAGESFRSRDPASGVVAVGEAMAETFRAAGIPTLHLTEMFDADSYGDAYSRAAAAIRETLAAHPSIEVILDVHRDSILRADGAQLRPVLEENGQTCAQVMLVVGTDERGAVHPRWQDNLSFALKVQSRLIADHPGLARALDLRGAAFNEQYRAGSLLVEIGACGSSLSEARRAGVLTAVAVADAVTGGGCVVEPEEILSRTAARPPQPGSAG